ncbi:helix-turn-helix domain-containing protein [Paraburkholderia sp. IMGN_8]|uniref:IclR family transcriptional regulator n=1 Tax=Paraburkholderia sp. IMGN_8 TaxID=3136564 RepID=UPI003100BC30
MDSLQRGLQLLRLFDLTTTSLSIAQVALRTGLPRPTAVRLVNTLVAERFITAIEGTDLYRPGFACHQLGNAFLQNEALVRAASPVLGALAERTGSSVCVGVRERLDMLFVLHLPRLGANDRPLQGATVPMAASLLGRVWLWAQPPHLQADLIQQIRREVEPQYGRVAISAVYRAFHDLEICGYCAEVNESSANDFTIAMPLQVRDTVNAAVSCTATLSDFNTPAAQSNLANQLTDALEAIKKDIVRVDTTAAANAPAMERQALFQ